jgi:WD40 repeat protein
MQTDSKHSPIATTSRAKSKTPGQLGHWTCDCGKTLKFEYHRAGMKGRCPACGRTFTIPAAAPLGGAELTLCGHKGPVQAVAVSPDNRMVATSAEVVASEVPRSELAETMLWDTTNGHLAGILRWHRKPVVALAFSPDSQWLATGSQDHSISIWDVERGLWDSVRCVHEHVLRGHDAPISAVSFAPNGELLASAGEDGTIRLWETTRWGQTRAIRTDRTGAGRSAFSPCGQYLASAWASRGPVLIWKTVTGEKHLELRLWSTEETGDHAVAFSSDGKKLAVLGHQQVRLWELSTCQVLASIDAPGSETLAITPRDNLIATAGLDPETGANVTLWDASTLVSMREFDGHSQSVSAIAFSADGKLLVSGDRGGIANVWLLR